MKQKYRKGYKFIQYCAVQSIESGALLFNKSYDCMFLNYIIDSEIVKYKSNSDMYIFITI